jgi:hypothetical protein
MEKNKLGQLCYWLTKQAQGRELIHELKMMLSNDPALPKPAEVLAQFGGAELFMATRAGQLSMLKYIELHAKGYLDQENALKEKQNKEDVRKAKKEKKQ